jgi:hypothetical protein
MTVKKKKSTKKRTTKKLNVKKDAFKTKSITAIEGGLGFGGI